MTLRTMLLTLALTALSVQAENWPRFRGPSGQGISSETGLPAKWSATENVAWKTPIPGEGWSSPIVFDDRVYVTAATGGGASFRLVCLDRLKGAVVWDKEVLTQKAGHRAGQNSYASSTPVTDGECVYVVAADGSIAAVTAGGDVRWAFREVKYYSEHGLGVSPILYKDLVIVAFDGSSEGPDKGVGWHEPWDQAQILALDKKSGQVAWRGKRVASRIAHVTPLVLDEGGRVTLVSSAGDVIQGFDLATGERRWTVSSEGEGVVPSLVGGDGLVFATSGFGKPRIRAIRTGGMGDVTKTHIAWESDKDVPMIPSLLYVKPHLFAVSSEGVVTCFAAASGEVLGRRRLGGKCSASPVWAAGRIHILSEKGEATIVEAGPGLAEIARCALGEKCCASPAISRGNIFIRTERAIYCIGQSPR